MAKMDSRIYDAGFSSEKLFLDQDGLITLIDKVVDLKTKLVDMIEDSNEDLADQIGALITMLQENFQWNLSDGSAVSFKGDLKDLQDLAAALRKELGKTEDITNEEGYETVYAAIDDLVARLKDLEDVNAGTRLTNLENKGFTDVDVKNDLDEQKIVIDFYSENKPIADNVPVKSIEINTADFIMHGILSNVHLITLTQDDIDAEEVTVGTETIEVPSDIRVQANADKKFLIFEFKVEHDSGNSEENTHGNVNHIWLDVESLFNDYEFKAVSTDEDYVEIKVVETHMGAEGEAEGQNLVTYTLSLGDSQKRVNRLVEGTEYRDPQNIAKGYYKGIEALNVEADDIREKVDKLVEEVEKDETGLLDRTEKVEGRTDNLELAVGHIQGFIDEQSIDPAKIEAYWVYYVDGNREEAGTPPTLD